MVKFLALLSLFPTIGWAADYTFLGSGTGYADSNGNQYRIANGQQVSVDLKKKPPLVTTKDPLTGEKLRLKVPAADLRKYFDSNAYSFSSVFSPGWDALGKLNRGRTSCAQEPAELCGLNRLVGKSTRYSTMEVLLKCAPDKKLDIVKRANTIPLKDYKNSCKNKARRPAAASPDQWVAPKPPPDCTPEQAKILRANERTKHAAYSGSCPANDSPKIKGLISPEPSCMLLAPPKEKITKVVLHATEGSPNASMGALYCDYSKSYNDMPYHYIVGRDPVTKQWRIFEGRNTRYQGAHVRANLNADSIAVAIAGDYDGGGPSPTHPFAKTEAPPAEAVQLVQSLVANLKNRYPKLNNIQGHGEALFQGDHCHKGCPGPACQLFVRRMREKFFPGGAR